MQTVSSARFSERASGFAAALVMAALTVESGMVHAQSAPTEEPVPATPDAPSEAEAAPTEAAGDAEPAIAMPPVEAEAGAALQAGGEPPTVTVAPVDIAPAEVAAAAEPASHTASYVLWGLGGASLVLGTVYGVLALTAKSDFDDGPTTSRADTVHNRAIVSDVGLGLGAILAITGTVYYFVKDDAEKTAQNAPKQQRALNDLRVAPFVGPRASGGTLSLRF